MNLLLNLQDGLGQAARLLGVSLEQVIGDALGRLGTNARQAASSSSNFCRLWLALIYMRVLERHARDVEAASDGAICLLASSLTPRTASLTAAMIMSCSISTSSGSSASGSMVRLTSSISPLTVTLTMPPPAEASTVWDLRFSCAAASCSCILRACFIICCMFIPAMMAPLRAAARQAARAAGARRNFQTQKSYHGVRPANGAGVFPQLIYMSLSVTHAQDYAKLNNSHLHNIES